MKFIYLILLIILVNCSSQLTVNDLLSQGYVIDKIQKNSDGYSYTRFLKKNGITYKCNKVCEIY